MEQKTFCRAVTAAFSGHRYIDASQREAIKKRLTKAVLDAYENGIRNFISGFAVGYDILAAEMVVSLKSRLPDITLIAAIPFNEQASRFNDYNKLRYDKLLKAADEVIVLSQGYFPMCFLERDEFMVNNASLLIAFYDGRERGGTFYTIKRAKERGVPIVNVF